MFTHFFDFTALIRLPLSFTFEVQHFLSRMEPLLRGVEVISLPRPGVQLVRNPIAVVLRDVRHALALR